jgi:hypothetical protein
VEKEHLSQNILWNLPEANGEAVRVEGSFPNSLS